MKFEFNWPSGFRGEDVWKCWRTDDGRTDDGVTGILIAHHGAFGSGELKSWLMLANTNKISCKFIRNSMAPITNWASTEKTWLCLSARLFICALWSPVEKGLTSWLLFVMPFVSLSLSHWYPGSGVVLDCIDSWSLHPILLWCSQTTKCRPAWVFAQSDQHHCCLPSRKYSSRTSSL